MSRWKDTISKCRGILIFAALAAVIYIGTTVVYPLILRGMAEKSPVTSIEAVNDRIYTAGMEIRKRDFIVKAVHENGMTTRLQESEFKLSTKTVTPYGKYTKVKIMLKDDARISCMAEAKNRREKTKSYSCGSPEIDSVKAVLYSNGELCFEGKGDILQFNEGEFPWEESEEDIKYVTFEKDVTPTSMDYFFEGMESLEYASSVPFSVTSMSGTFAGCVSLPAAPAWGNCDGLLDISGCYEGCTSLVSVPDIPASVRSMEAAFEACESLQDPPVLASADSMRTAKDAFKDCIQLTKAEMPPFAEDISGMYSGCINLKDMPEIPESVINMNSAFSGDLSLSTLTVIPEHVTDAGSCFENCRKIDGVLWVDANPEEFSNCFEGAASATSVDLQGNSSLMDAIANTGENITVNGQLPDPEIQSYDDVFAEEFE